MRGGEGREGGGRLRSGGGVYVCGGRLVEANIQLGKIHKPQLCPGRAA